MKKNETVVLNAEQQAVVDAREGVHICVAGPGSGKTETLIRRYLAMLGAGIPSKDILNLSFTSAAATEMVKRAGGLLNAESVFRTFHSFAIEILKKEKEFLPFKICDTVIPVAMEEYQLLFDLVKIYPAINWRTLQEKITKWKCDNILPDRAIDEARNNGIEYFYALAYRDYEIKCREQGWLDFDDCIREVVNILETNEEVRSRWKRKYIAIDECQDTDEIQARMIELLFNGNLFCVGDMNQGVYEWRSAAPTVLIDFVKRLPGAQTLFLGENFRSTKALVSFFKEIIPVDNGLASHMITHNEEGESPTIVEYANEDEEAREVLKSVTDPLNTAVIARTNRQLFTFQKLCTMKEIKYKILGKRDFWEQNEVKKLLKLAKDIHDDRSASIVLTDLIQSHNLLNLYRYSGNPLESNPIENLNSVVKMAAGRGNITEFLTFLRKLTGARRSHKGLTLSTCHQAKGHEWDHVFLVGIKQGLLPHKDGELAEESRIFFVGASRAAKNLHISFYDSPSMFLNNYHDRIVKYQAPEEEDGAALYQFER